MRQARTSLIALLAFGVIASAMIAMRAESPAREPRAVRVDAEAPAPSATSVQPRSAVRRAAPIAPAQTSRAASAPAADTIGGSVTASAVDGEPIIPPEVAAQVTDEQSSLADDDTMNDDDDLPEQRVWRARWIEEQHDAEWTERVRQELHEGASAEIGGKLGVENLDCRQTLCIMHLTFADEVDAVAFQQRSRSGGLRYTYQSLDPDRSDGFDDSGYIYELIIEREL